MNKPSALICMRANPALKTVPSAATYDRRCSRCDSTVLIGASGRRFLAERTDFVILCNECYRPDPGDVARPAPGAVEEALAAIVMSRKNWN